MYSAFLADLKCEIALAPDGMSALTQIRVFQPDLILLDIVLPEISGFEICRLLKEDPATSKIQVLMITSLDEREAVEHASDVGTDDYLIKPISKADLIKRVEKLLQHKSNRDPFSS